uniref:Si:dkey-154p10.3 n=1 Tax=Astyanax mexicanus TaxID=7994 RepID=A0A3B1KCV8_ASTMX
MERHWKGHGSKRSSRPHKCALCPKAFRRVDSRDAHEKRHNRRHRMRPKCSPVAQCPLCLEWCQSEREWEIHQRCHSQGGFKCFYCDVTGKTLCHIKVTLIRYNTLVKVCAPGYCADVEFFKTSCYSKFSSKLTMRRHMGIHQGDKPFECPHCHYSTRLKASLIQHLRVHTGEKPYKCPQCSYASIDRSSLRRHLRTHTQEKPYHCQYCPYSCIQKKSLDLHSRRHHTGESFPCPLCQYSTPDRQLLLRHTHKHHSTEQSTTS